MTFFFANILIELRTVSMPLRQWKRESYSRVPLLHTFLSILDIPVVRRVGLEDGLLVRWSEQRAGKAEDASCLADAGRALFALKEEREWVVNIAAFAQEKERESLCV